MLNGPLTCELPISKSLFAEIRFRVVMRQQFGLHFNRLGKLRRQRLRNPLMILLACALE